MSARSSILTGSLLTLIFLVTSCGGGGGGGGSSSSGTDGGAGASGGVGSALSVADSVSVVDAQSSASSSISGLMKAAVSALPSTSDYNTDPTSIFVNEQSADALKTINDIFCSIGQTGYKDMLNLGDYLAQIDNAQCNSSSNDSPSGKEGANTSAGVPDFESWTLNSFRADDNSPLVLSAWIHMNGNEFEQAQIIQARFNVFEEPSDSNPYGIMSGYFKATRADTGEDSFNGYIISELQDDGSVVLKFYDSFGEAVALTHDGSTISGNAAIDNGGESFSYQFAADDNFFYRQAGGAQGDIRGCMSRTQFDETTNRYNLYYNESAANPGARVELNSGFSAVFIDAAGDRHNGYVGFFGSWFPDDVNPSSGDTVYKQTFESGAEPTETPYTLFKSGGKLNKQTLATLALTDMAGVPLSWQDCSASGCTEYVVEWNETTQKLNKIATVNQDTHTREELATPEAVTFGNDDWSFNGWSEALGGGVMIELRNNSTSSLITLANTTPVIFHREEVVMPGDTVPASLICFENCLDPSKIDTDDPYFTKSAMDAGDDSFTAKDQSVASTKLVADTNYIAYTFDTTNMVLQYKGTAVQTSSASTSDSGVWTNYLIEPTTANLAAIACPWSSSATCPWQAFTDISVMYTYQTGENEWNVLSLLQDPATEKFLTFDQPINLEYHHLDNGNTYFLNYGGQGDLWGIPGKCVDISTGADANCGDWQDNSPIRWVNEFSIPDGSALGNYYIKGIDKEQRMIGVTEQNCIDDGLTFTTLDVPAGEDYQDPDIGDEPALESAAPAVIGGVLQ